MYAWYVATMNGLFWFSIGMICCFVVGWLIVKAVDHLNKNK